MLPMRKYHSIESLYILLIIIMNAHFNIVATGTRTDGAARSSVAARRMGWRNHFISYVNLGSLRWFAIVFYQCGRPALLADCIDKRQAASGSRRKSTPSYSVWLPQSKHVVVGMSRIDVPFELDHLACLASTCHIRLGPCPCPSHICPYATYAMNHAAMICSPSGPSAKSIWSI